MGVTQTRQGRASADAVRDYLDRIGRIPLLTAAQEVELARLIGEGAIAESRLAAGAEPAAIRDGAERAGLAASAAAGRRARARMTEANLRLVVSVARRHTGRGLSLLDLVQEGNIGLMRAIERFDPALGFKFSTYAVWWIRQAIGRALADQGRTIRIPAHMVERINKLGRTRARLRTELGREPEPAELAAALDVTAERLAAIEEFARREPVSLHAPAGAEGEGELGDLIEDRGRAAAGRRDRPRAAAPGGGAGAGRADRARGGSDRLAVRTDGGEAQVAGGDRGGVRGDA
ncbi:sigma-70 family RNA polymerase sigma factor [Streptomyces sp. NPDC004134]|uniref:sigma-70 family RNA polymerase sigma factor n=1 Tax=Streptomyces sp. NPDC004134 TaxID=3364691 RepID=UPI00367C6208